MPLLAQLPLTDAEELDIANKVQSAKNFQQICAIFGYRHEEHVVTTDDGYLLLLQRILARESSASSSPTQGRRRVVYVQHGLCTNSEMFMRVTDARKCIPLVLAERGYDVWMGNNRLVPGNLS